MRFANSSRVGLLLALMVVGSRFTSPSLSASARGHGKSSVEPSQDNYDEGKHRYDAKDYAGAIDSFLQAIYFARNGYNPDAYFWLGAAYAETKQDGKAIEALKKSIEQNVNGVPSTHLLLGEIYLRNGRLNEARIEAGNALGPAPGTRMKAYNLMGKVYEAQGNLQVAADHFLNALGQRPWRYTEAWVNYGEVLIKQRNYEGAYTQLTNLLNSPVGLKDVPNETVYLDVGLCLLAKGNHQGALDNWHQVLKYNPDNFAAHLQIAELLDQEHHFSSAVKEYKEYIRTCPNEQDIAKAKFRVATLEQQLQPQPIVVPPVVREPQPTPEQMQAEKSRIEKDRENLNQPGQRDSGF